MSEANGEYPPVSGSAVWICPAMVNSSRFHAYREGKALCGSPLAAGHIRSDTRPPRIVGCKRCLELTQNAKVRGSE